MEEQDPMFEDTSANQAKAWIQENLRIIVSVFIVAAIALGIYSYSQRTQTLSDQESSSFLDSKGGDTVTGTTEQDKSEQSVKAEVNTGAQVSQELSRETETSFVEQASRGNGSTHLARRALTNYLEKNADSSLTVEHKIYIEDYLRKNVGFRGTVTTKTSIEFSKTLISQAIEKSKTLNNMQLQNLKKYSARVSAYR